LNFLAAIFLTLLIFLSTGIFLAFAKVVFPQEIGGLICEAGQANTTKTYHFDQVGSTLARTDDSGKVIGQAEYSAYGLTFWKQGDMATPFLYNGQAGVQTDPNGMLNMRARYYSPYLMRFLNADPSGFSGGPNWFANADGNPISKSDPFGLCATEPAFYRLRRESQPGDHFYPGVNPGESFWGFAIRSAGNTLANPGFMNSMSFGGPGSNFMGTTGLPIKSLDRPAEATTPAASNVAVRQGYLNSLEAIPGQINMTARLREQAMQAFNLRNAAKIDARAAMADGGALLYKTDPIPTIQDVVRLAYQDKGLVGDDIWCSILES
jgi:RHS repeat-associated protein